MDLYDQFVNRTDNRLTQMNFKLWRKVSIADVSDTDVFATRVEWRVARNSEHVFLHHKIIPTTRDFDRLFETGLAYARRAYPVPLPLQFWTNYRLIGCIATTNVNQELIEYVTERPGEFWERRIVHGYYQLPVLIDLQTEKSYYYKGPFCRALRKVTSDMLGE